MNGQEYSGEPVTSKNLSTTVIAATIDPWQESGQQRWWPTAGGSMMPLIANGDEVLLQFDFHDLHRGDIVVFRRDTLRPDGLIAHRIIRVYQDDRDRVILTKGDNCAMADAPVARQDILGRVVAIRRAGESMDMDTPARRRRARLIASLSLAVYMILATGRQMARWLRLPQSLPGGNSARRIGQAASRVASRLLIK